MKQLKRKREFIPPWRMPSDPIKAVFWFMHWLLKLLVNLFWVPILGMAGLEVYFNWRIGGLLDGLVGGVITLLVGVAVWGALYGVLAFVNVSTGISQVISGANRMQRNTTYRNPYFPPPKAKEEDNVVEGTITDLEEERKKRRHD